MGGACRELFRVEGLTLLPNSQESLLLFHGCWGENTPESETEDLVTDGKSSEQYLHDVCSLLHALETAPPQGDQSPSWTPAPAVARLASQDKSTELGGCAEESRREPALSRGRC